MSAKSRTISWTSFSAALFFAPAIAGAQTLPAFSTDIVPNGLSLTIVSQKEATETGKTETDTFTINTGFTGSDFTDDLIDLISSGGTLEVGVAPNGSCRTGETILPPISIPMSGVTHTTSSGDDIFAFTSPHFSANWTISPFEVSSGGSGQSGGSQNTSVSCINGNCTVTGGSGSTIINNNGSVIIENNSVGGSGGATPTDEMTFKATASVAGIIPLPQTPVDVFFLLYPNPSGALEGGCVTLHSISVNNQMRNVIGKTTVTSTYAAH